MYQFQSVADCERLRKRKNNKLLLPIFYNKLILTFAYDLGRLKAPLELKLINMFLDGWP